MIHRLSFCRALLSASIFSMAMGVGSYVSADIWQDSVMNERLSVSAKARPLIARAGQARGLMQSRKLNLNVEALKYTLNQAPDEHLGISNMEIDLPLPNGEMVKYSLYHSPIMEKSLSDQFPDIQTFKIIDRSNPENSGRLDLTPEGFHGMLTHLGKTVFIDPIGMTGQYQSYYKSDYVMEMGEHHAPMMCGAERHEPASVSNQSPMQRAHKPAISQANRHRKFSFGTNIRTYRLAVAATGEFSAFHGGTKESSLAAIVTGINRVNQVFETDLAVKLELVANNSEVIYTDAATDPFTDDDPDELITEIEAELDSKIGNANYDIGHVFSTGGGGLAALNSVCGAFKAQGVTGISQPINDVFFIEYVAHEIGHQFGARHTFNSASSDCADNRSPTAAYEPGSGSTIMSYAGICTGDNVSNIAQAYFHTHSITEISTYIADGSRGGSCGMNTGSTNAVPVPNAGPDGHIPISTPFILLGSATDTNTDDSLSYTWEQYDLGAATSSEADHVDDGSRPLFRSFLPNASPDRIIPQISDVLSGMSTFGEVLPTLNRDLNFRLTVRDGKGGVASDDKKLTVAAAAGPFTITAPMSNVSWETESTQTVIWDVSNTTAAPISCDTVNIALSQDGGLTFGAPLLGATPNDGTQTLTIPDVETTMGRIRVMCASQPFFAINSGTITITRSGGGGTANSAPVANADSFTVEQESAATRFNVLSNDTDADSDDLTVTGVSNVNNGIVSFSASQLTYQPASGFSGTDMFNYSISDGNGGTASGVVTVTVNPAPVPNTPPIANNDSYTVEQDSAEIVLDLLANDTDEDGDTLSLASVTNATAGGSLSINTRNVRFTPAAGFSGTVTFNYTVSDGTDPSAPANVSITVNAAAPTPTPTPTPPSASASRGGGSFGVFMLLLLGIARKFKSMRLKTLSSKRKV